MRITRLSTGPDGQSHFEDIDIALNDHGAIGRISEAHPATGIMFREAGGDYDYDWHNAPRRQYVVILEGEVEITIGDGTTRRFGAGEILLAEDTEGAGHISRSVENKTIKSLFITID